MLFDRAEWIRAVTEDREFGPALVRAAVAFSHLTDSEGFVRNSRPKIASDLGVAIRVFDKTVKSLEAGGYAIVERSGGRGHWNTYALVFPEREDNTISGPDPEVIQYFRQTGKRIDANGIRAIELSRGEDFDPKMVAKIQPFVEKLFGKNGRRIFDRLPHGYKIALIAMYATGLLSENDLSAARALAFETSKH